MIYFDSGLEPIDIAEDLWWQFYLPEPLGLETMQPLVDEFGSLGMQVIKDYISDPHYTLVIRDTQLDTYFEISNGDDVSAFLSLGVKADRLIPPDTIGARVSTDWFLELGKVCYMTIRPYYAFAESLNLFVEPASLLSGHLPWLGWAQLLGPQLVEQFGRSILSNAPSWRNENLGDGGILYVLAASPFLHDGPRQRWAQAKQYFGDYVAEPIKWGDQSD